MGITNIITFQPFKGVYVFLAILLNAAQLPLWMIYYIPKALRPHPQYSLRQTLQSRIARHWLWHCSNIRIQTPLLLTADAKDLGRLVSIPVSAKQIYTGVCASKTTKPEAICAYWYPSPFDAATDAGKKVVLHFHGGAFVIGDCRPKESGFAGGLLSKHIGKTLMVSYRLSSNKGGAFPAALQDAVSSYQFLLDAGVRAQDIVIGGDSAGGNLAIALLRFIAESNGVLPDAGAALLWSPWVDVEAALDPNSMPSSPHNGTDYLTSTFGMWGALTYAPKEGEIGVTSPWVSPKKFPFKTGTPVWVQAGGQEILLEDDTEFMEGMKGVVGNVVGWHMEEVAPHDIILAGALTGFEEAAERSTIAAKKWLGTL